MTASEVVRALEALIELCGDQEVVRDDHGVSAIPVTRVIVRADTGCFQLD